MRRRAHEGSGGAQQQHLVWLGNFNLHHPSWDEEQNSHLFTRCNLDRAQWLIDTTAELDLQMALPRGIPTLQVMLTGNYTHPDNFFVSTSLCGAVMKWGMAPEEQLARTDHMPVITLLDTGLMCQTEPPSLNYQAGDWDMVIDELMVRLRKLEAGEA